MKVQALALWLCFGQGASVLTTGRPVMPESLLKAGFGFGNIQDAVIDRVAKGP